MVTRASLALKGKVDPDAEPPVARIKERARNLYLTRQLLCTEAVVMALNNSLDGGLSLNAEPTGVFWPGAILYSAARCRGCFA